MEKQQEIYNWAKDQPNNVVTRNLIDSCEELFEIEESMPANTSRFSFKKDSIICYGCSKTVKSTHADYVFSCFDCGSKFQKCKNIKRDLTGKTFLVIGARTKLGHQVVIRLLSNNANVICTTRFPEKALELYKKYKNYPEWSSRLTIYPNSLDLDTPDIQSEINKLVSFINKPTESVLENHGSDFTNHPLNGLIICAAQTIRAKDKIDPESTEQNNVEPEPEPENRYQEHKFIPKNKSNSWNLTIYEIEQSEAEEVYRINAIAPMIIIRTMIPLLRQCNESPYIINVHAREGLFLGKSCKHYHTNMSKAALAMLTWSLRPMNLKTTNGHKFLIHGIDPGWISVDEYYEESRPWIVPPLTEIDGAARIVYPIMADLKYSCFKTRRHYTEFIV
jgi:NAD(P)-dependent dehydrogenase (short-subunit alcohol dehydrogenase family)